MNEWIEKFQTSYVSYWSKKERQINHFFMILVEGLLLLWVAI